MDEKFREAIDEGWEMVMRATHVVEPGRYDMKIPIGVDHDFIAERTFKIDTPERYTHTIPYTATPQVPGRKRRKTIT